MAYTASDGSYVYSQYWPSGTVAAASLLMSMMIHTLCLEFSQQVHLAQANVGECADVVAGTGSTTTGQSWFQFKWNYV